MDKAPAYGAGDSRFDPGRGYICEHQYIFYTNSKDFFLLFPGKGWPLIVDQNYKVQKAAAKAVPDKKLVRRN